MYSVIKIIKTGNLCTFFLKEEVIKTIEIKKMLTGLHLTVQDGRNEYERQCLYS